jgi:hypothetical protein
MTLEEEAFFPSSVLLSNISKLSGEQSVLQERRICELAAVADSAVNYLVSMHAGGMPIVDALSLLFLESEEAHSVHADALGECVPQLSLHLGVLSVLDRIALAALLGRGLERRALCPAEADFLPPSGASETFTYVKNLYADEAYDVFSEAFSDPRLFYSETLKDAVAAVTEGRAGYCLLPLEEKGGARLATVSEMLYRSDLRIASVTPVYGYGEENDLTYALVSRGFCIPAVDPEDDRYLEIRIPKDSCRLSELLLAAEGFGAQVYRIHTLAFSAESEKKAFYSLVFRAEGQDFVSLLIYLSIFYGDFTPIGIYASLES